jgi:hypothetical protein
MLLSAGIALFLVALNHSARHNHLSKQRAKFRLWPFSGHSARSEQSAEHVGKNEVVNLTRGLMVRQRRAIPPVAQELLGWRQ